MASVNWSQQLFLFAPSAPASASVSSLLQTIADRNALVLECNRSLICLRAAGDLSKLVHCQLVIDPVWDPRLSDSDERSEAVNSEELEQLTKEFCAICRPGGKGGEEDERQFANRILGAVNDSQDCSRFAVVSKEVLQCAVACIEPRKEVKSDVVLAKVDLDARSVALFTVEEVDRCEPLRSVNQKVAAAPESVHSSLPSEDQPSPRPRAAVVAELPDRYAQLRNFLNLQLAQSIYKPLCAFQETAVCTETVKMLKDTNSHLSSLHEHFQATWARLTAQVHEMRDVKDSHLASIRQVMDSFSEVSSERERTHMQLQQLVGELTTQFDMLRRKVESKVSCAKQLAKELAALRANGEAKPKPMTVLSVSNTEEAATVTVLSRKHYQLWVNVQANGEAKAIKEQCSLHIGTQAVPISPLPNGEYTIVITDLQGVKQLSDPFKFSTMPSHYYQSLVYTYTSNIPEVEEAMGPQTSLILRSLAVAWKNIDISSIASFIQTVLDNGDSGEWFVYQQLCKLGYTFYRDYVVQVSST